MKTLAQCKDEIARSRGSYSNWDEYYNWIARDGALPSVVAQLIEAATEEAVMLFTAQVPKIGKHKPFIAANVREITDQFYNNEDISFSRMVELFNAVAENYYSLHPVPGNKSIADLNHIVINACMNIYSRVTDRVVISEVDKIIEQVKSFTSQHPAHGKTKPFTTANVRDIVDGELEQTGVISSRMVEMFNEVAAKYYEQHPVPDASKLVKSAVTGKEVEGIWVVARQNSIAFMNWAMDCNYCGKINPDGGYLWYQHDDEAAVLTTNQLYEIYHRNDLGNGNPYLKGSKSYEKWEEFFLEASGKSQTPVPDEADGKGIGYWRKNAEENYLTTPISVLRYINKLEATSQLAGTESYLIYNNDKVNSILSVALKNLDTEQLEVLRDCLIERTPLPAQDTVRLLVEWLDTDNGLDQYAVEKVKEYLNTLS